MDCNYARQIIIKLHEPNAYDNIHLKQSEMLSELAKYVQRGCNCGHQDRGHPISCCGLDQVLHIFCDYAQDILRKPSRLEELDAAFLENHAKLHHVLREPEGCVQRTKEKYEEKIPDICADGDGDWCPAMGSIGNGPAF